MGAHIVNKEEMPGKKRESTFPNLSFQLNTTVVAEVQGPYHNQEF